jgi:large subunit ribosomal protein L9
LRALDEERKQSESRKQRESVNAQKLAAQIEKISLTLKMKVGEENKLFGAVTTQMIADALKDQGVTVDKRAVVVPEPIKALGIYTVEVHLHTDVNAKLKVWVVEE